MWQWGFCVTQKADTVTAPAEKEAAEKSVKNRTLGNVRLIAELYKKGLVMEKIMHNCIKDLLSTGKEDEIPHEDNLEVIHLHLLYLFILCQQQMPSIPAHLPAITESHRPSQCCLYETWLAIP